MLLEDLMLAYFQQLGTQGLVETSPRPGDDLVVESIVDAVRGRLADVVGHARGAEHGAGGREGDRLRALRTPTSRPRSITISLPER